jgi:hypothetical protein
MVMGSVGHSQRARVLRVDRHDGTLGRFGAGGREQLGHVGRARHETEVAVQDEQREP